MLVIQSYGHRMEVCQELRQEFALHLQINRKGHEGPLCCLEQLLNRQLKLGKHSVYIVLIT